MRISDWSSDVCSSDLLDEWRAAAARGHELGNHTLFHQCSGSGEDRDWVAPHRDLDTTPAARMRDQVLLANAMLAAIDGRHERTFTVPCGDAVAAGGNYVDLVAPDFVAIKLGSGARSEEHTSELQSLMRISYAVYCLKKKTQQ